MIVFILNNWRLLVFLAVLGALGVQTYRLQGAQGHLALARAEINARDTAALKQALADRRNKERTDEDYRNAQRRARLAKLRPTTPAAGFVTAAPGGGNDAAACFDREQLNRELTAWAGRVADRFTAIAQPAEEVAAAYRACGAWAREVAGSGTPASAAPSADAVPSR